MPSIANTTVQNPSRIRDYVALCKPRIAVMVILTVLVGGLLSGAGSQMGVLLNTALGVLLIASSGCALNQFLERYTDFLMPRTAKRPLPGGRLSSTEVAIFGAVTFGIGIAVMFMLCNWTVTILGLATWFLYVWIYTPAKVHTIYNTMIGAIPGAMPILIGAAASESGISWSAWCFFAVLLIWQFPHFMSIAWLYRSDYADGNIKMITVTDPSGFWAGIWAIGFGVILIPISCLPAMFVESSLGFWAIIVAGLSLGGWFLMASIRFSKAILEPTRHQESPNRGVTLDVHESRKLLRVSLLYLPFYMFVLIFSNLI